MWLLFAFSGPVLWAASTHIDKFLIDRYFHDSDTAVLMIFTALIGVVSLAAGSLAWRMDRRDSPARRRLGAGVWRTVSTAVACALVLACGALTFRQTLIYQDEETLWRDTLAKNPKAWIAHGNLAFLLAAKAMAPMS